MKKNTLEKRPYRQLSLLEFQDKFGTEKACQDYLLKMRWPDGFECKCGSKKNCFKPGRQEFRCYDCGRVTSPTAGTVFHRSKVPLRKWFWFIYLLSTSKKAVSTLYLQGQLQVNYRTVWCMRSKIQKAMSNRDAQYKLGGNIEADEIWIGGAQTHENRRKNGQDKTPFFIAVQENKSGQPMFVTTSELEGVFEDHIAKAVDKKIKPNSTLKTDGKSSYVDAAIQGGHTLEQSVEIHEPKITHEHLRWVNILTSNLKRYLLSTHHGVFKAYRKEYLAEFAYRFNRRFWPEQAFDRLLFANVFIGPTPIRRLGG